MYFAISVRPQQVGEQITMCEQHAFGVEVVPEVKMISRVCFINTFKRVWLGGVRCGIRFAEFIPNQERIFKRSG